MSEQKGILDIVKERVSDMPVVAGRGRDELFTAFMVAVRSNERILGCKPNSIIMAVEKFATLGLRQGEAHFVPYGTDCQLILDYTGLITLMCRGGKVLSVDTQLVHKGDTFRVELGTDPTIHHTPDLNNPARSKEGFTHVYAIVRFSDGSQIVELMDTPEVDRIKATSRGNVWKQHPGEMARKTVLRRIAKRIPKVDSPDYDRLAEGVRQYDQTEGLDLASSRDELKARVEAASGTGDMPEPVEETRELPAPTAGASRFVDEISELMEGE